MPQPEVGRARSKSSANSDAACQKRRSHNRKLALAYAQAGIPIFPSIGKTPVCLEWTRLDTSLSPLDIADALAKAVQRAETAGRDFDDTIPVGATIDVQAVRAMWDKFPDAVPSISLGPAKLYVLDADIDVTRDGPELIREWLAANEIQIDACPITTSQSGGEHVFFRTDDPLRSHVGATMDACYVQVRSTGGQVVAPGAWRDDGKMYKSKPGQPSLIAAYTTNALPAVPAPLLALQNERNSSSEAKSNDAVSQAIDEIRTVETDDFETLADVYDFDRLAKKDEEFAAIWREPSEDTSANRFTLAKCLHREFGQSFGIADFATLLSGYDGAGEYVGDDPAKQHEYNNRSIARDYLASQNTRKITDGKSFGAVEDDGDLPAHYVEAKRAKLDPPAEAKPARASLIQLDTDAVATWTPIDWLVNGLIPRGAIGIAFGPPDALKSFVLIDVACHIVRGLPWFGNRVEKAGVVFWFGEGRQGIAGRFKAWTLAHDAEGGAVGLADCPVNFLSDAKVEKTLRQMALDYEAATGQRCELMIFDTWSKATIGLKENDNGEVAAALGRAERAAKKLNITILFVAHTGKDGARGVRGASALEGNVDFRLEFRDRQIIVERMKDAAKREPLGYGARPVEIGRNKHGEPVTSLVITQAFAIDRAARTDPRTAPKPERLSPAQASVLGSIEALARRMADKQSMPVGMVDVSIREARADLDATRGEPMSASTFDAAKFRLVRKGLLLDSAKGAVRLSGSEFGFPCDDDE